MSGHAFSLGISVLSVVISIASYVHASRVRRRIYDHMRSNGMKPL